MRISEPQQAYYEKVWDFVRRIPHGKVVTYGQIAQALPEPQLPESFEDPVPAARLVGSAMAASPDGVPWHRVINAQGKISNRPEAAAQLHLLEAEGLSFVQGAIDLDEHQWEGPDAPPRPKQQQLF